MEKTVYSANSSGAQVLVMRADMVFGLDHVRSALFHAKKSLDERRNSSDSLSMESLLYASGERQLSTAVKKMCVDLTTEELVVARLSEGDVGADSSWRILDDRPHDTSTERLKKFGITQQELDTIGSRDPGDLVLEMVAAVDIIKK
jgi:KEOPS complex subunit Cgi121